MDGIGYLQGYEVESHTRPRAGPVTGWITVIGTTLALSLFSPYAEKIP
jgi:hypothetical protein